MNKTLLLCMLPALSHAAVVIHSLETDKMVYRPGEPIRLSAQVENTGKAPCPVKIEIIRRNGIDNTASEPSGATLKPGRQTLKYQFTAQGEYGKEFQLVIRNGKQTAERSVLCEVYPGLIKFPRIQVLCVDSGYYLSYPDKSIVRNAVQYRKSYCNILKFFEWMPVWSEVVPTEDWWFSPRWKNDISKRRMKEIEKFKVSKAKIIKWKQELQKNGIKLIGYDNLTVAPGYIWQKYGRLIDPQTRKPMRLWFRWDDLYSPNTDRYAPEYGRKMRQSVEMFGWDGFFHDSFVGWSRRTAKALNEQGGKATELDYDGVQSKVLGEIERNLKDISPDFIQMVNGLPWEVMSLQKEVEGKMLRITDRATLKSELIRNREKFDPLTAKHPNIIWMSEVVTSKPANRLYHTFGLIHQSVRQFTSQVVSNSSLSYRKWDKAEDFAPALAMYYANGLGTYSRFNLNRECLEIYRKYTEFAIRYSEFLFDPQLKWIDENSVSASVPEIYFADTSFVKKDGEKITCCMNLLNLPANRDFFKGEHEKPEIRKNFRITCRIPAGTGRIRCHVLSPDNDGKPLELKVREDNGTAAVTVPELEYWDLLIWQFTK